MNSPTPLLVVISIVCIWCAVILKSNRRARRSSRLPPGPYQIPIIGNILELGSRPHRSLAKLSRKYGPVMLLKLGGTTTVVISSAEAAKAVLQKHDVTLSSRTIPAAATSLKHNEFSIVWLPVGSQWRKLRRICKEEMFTGPRLDAGKGLRREKLRKLRQYVEECCEAGRAVDIGDAAFTTSLNLISATLFSVEFDSESSHEMKDVVWQVMKWAGKPNLADYFPLLKSADPQRISKQTEIHFGVLASKFGEIIDRRLESRGEKNDLLEVLIDLNQGEDGAQLSRNDIIHLLIDLFIGGSDTTSSSVEWAVAQLLRHPTKMSRVREEMSNAGIAGEIEESDIARLPYLQAVVKETFRLHPTVPFLVPRRAERDVEINGYLVPRDAQVLVNAWAIGRDPSFWADAESFKPERFLILNNEEHATIDFRGRDFGLIPFGAGRRMCPGLPLAHRMVHLMLATLLRDFDWKLEAVHQDMNMDDKFGLSIQKATPVTPVPTKLHH